MVVNMDGPSAKKSTSFETLVIQTIENVCDLKAKLNEIICSGKNYEYDVSSCLKALLKSSDHAIVQLTVQAISELAKCELKRETYSHKDVIEPILSILNKELTVENMELHKQCVRALGNLCFDCDNSRKILLEYNGVATLNNILQISVKDTKLSVAKIKLFVCKILLNYAIGGFEFSDSLVKGGVIENIRKILSMEAQKEVMDNDLVSTALLILSVANDNDPELLYEEEVNLEVFHILKETSNVEVSELCFEHLHTQAEHDSVKTLLAKEGAIKLVCLRLEQLVQKHEAGDMNMEKSEIDTVVKHACDLIIMVLTGDDAMDIIFAEGCGAVYASAVCWLRSASRQLLATALLAVGNFARRDDYCARIMGDGIYDRLLNIFKQYYEYSLSQKDSDQNAIDRSMVTKIQHGALSALRNLTVSVASKKFVAAQGRAAPIFINALPNVEDHHVAYKLLAALRMLLDGQEAVARQLAGDVAALRGVARWGGAGGAGAAAEAPRLIAWTVRLLPRDAVLKNLLQAEGCISCLVNMLVASHSVMQNEAILALTLLAVAPFNEQSDTDETEMDFNSQLIKSEIGKHISVLIETNCAKMPIQVAENLIAFLDITSKDNTLVSDYKDSKVNEALQKFVEARKDLSDDLKACIGKIIKIVSDNNKE
ncbi:GTPase-GDP dissociation stimulator vimar [Bicyclus anynana]|uniref:GTPase-GDP dissociation stimulator vimar n=1 Tax=Bicyclus anynana TaxID=110368 RepID=A0A6J1MYC6_BICAN|nr:GTPase-GDP dissociation stimulator vimar [Bicyclus anynana]